MKAMTVSKLKESDNISRCCICNKPFKTGEYLQAFLRCPEDPKGSWTDPAMVDAEYQQRSQKVIDKIKRKHVECKL